MFFIFSNVSVYYFTKNEVKKYNKKEKLGQDQRDPKHKTILNK